MAANRQKKFDWDRFRRVPVVGILRGFACEQTVRMVEAAVDGGLANVEVTMNTPDAADQIRCLCERFGDCANIGAGTVCTLGDFNAATAAGAVFMVTPVVSPAVIAAGVAAGIPVFAGAFTPSEVYQAWELGAAVVKVFPADALGPTYIRSLKGPLQQIPLMPTGGITVESIGEYRRAGAEAFGVGSPLFSKTRAASGDWPWFADQARRFTESVRGMGPPHSLSGND